MLKAVVFVALAICAVVSGGCADEPRRGEPSQVRVPPVASQKSAAEQALILRREADSLREIASRREREAEILSRDAGSDERLVREKRELAQKLWHEADEVEQAAVAIGRQVPHNMVQ
jgi:hypothetical protein